MAAAEWLSPDDPACFNRTSGCATIERRLKIVLALLFLPLLATPPVLSEQLLALVALWGGFEVLVAVGSHQGSTT